jgi:beta-glucanase (GH16 family)
MLNPLNMSPVRLCFILWQLLLVSGLEAQVMHLVWADEFEGPVIDRSIWDYESGPTNDNVHYYTDRSENAAIVDGKLQIIARKENYRSYEYTSALLRTALSGSWKYGRMEARIKLPGSPGFVPAFWMLPADDRYGWWPESGEIDIMEYPTSEGSKIYGTVHTEIYNLFSGTSPPKGGAIEITDAESAFHLYAVEWTGEQIDFYVDGQNYFSFANDGGSSATWPFDEPFYIILNLAVGGGWVGSPDERTVFPGVMEIDFVRVYQYADQVAVQGPDFVICNSEASTYFVAGLEDTDYQWNVPGGATITSGQGTPQITVDWGIFGGNVEAVMTSGEGTFISEQPVRVSSNFMKNPGFEKGVKYWKKAEGFPVLAEFQLSAEEVQSGTSSLQVHVTDPGTQPWDVQLSQGDLLLEKGISYQTSFWAKAAGGAGNINAAIINAADYSLISTKTISPGESWEEYVMDFTAPSTLHAVCNIDMGNSPGVYHFDDFCLTTPGLDNGNQLKNPDFFDGKDQWNLTVYPPAEASASIQDGMYAVSIDNGGTYSWDIHLGQGIVSIENGKEYEVSFDAFASAPRPISPIVGKNADPWTVYSGDRVISLTTTKQTYQFSFTMTEQSDPESRFGFDLGGDTADVFFDNVMLSYGEPVNQLSIRHSANAESFRLLSNFPNPVSEQASFQWILYEPSRVRLRIYNLSGQEVRTLIDEFQQAGEHHLSWSTEGIADGLYFCQFFAGGSCETRKLVLKR